MTTTLHPRLACSSISFRKLPLPEALATIADLGFEEIDLGALPGVCDHVPYDLTDEAVAEVAATVAASGLTVRSVNGDIGDLNRPAGPERAEHLERLLRLTAAIGARALVLPCGAQSADPIVDEAADIAAVAAALRDAARRAADHGVELWTESLHYFRLCNDMRRATLLHSALQDSAVNDSAVLESAPEVGIVLDASHVVASGGDLRTAVEAFAPLVRHVHLRDARPGDIHLSIGHGSVDFAGGLAALRDAGYTGHFALELETRDVDDSDRPRATADAAAFISPLI